MRSVTEPTYRLFYPPRRDVWFECFYCGDPADTVDHQPPLSRVYDYRALGLAHEDYLKVPCCLECNVLLTDILHENIIQREIEVKNKLRKRYRKILKMPFWSKKDIKNAELTGSLRLIIEASRRQYHRVIHRIEYTDGINAFIQTMTPK